MKKVLFVINTLGGAGAERALLELLTRFTTEKYEVSLYVLLSQGELIHQVPDYVRVLIRIIRTVRFSQEEESCC